MSHTLSSPPDFTALGKYGKTMNNGILGHKAKVTASEIYLTNLKDTTNPFALVESCLKI